MHQDYRLGWHKSVGWAAGLCVLLVAAPATAAVAPSGEAVYIREVLDAARSGPNYARPNDTESPNRTTPRYHALVLQQVPGGAPVEVADCRSFPGLGPELEQVSIDATGRYVAVTSYIPEGRVLHRGPALFVYDIERKSLRKVSNCVQTLAWSPSGSRALISEDFGGGVHFELYDAVSGKTTTLFPAARNAQDTAWANDGGSVVYTDPSATVIEVNLETGRKTVRWRNSSGIVPSPNSPGYTASPYSENAIGGGWAGGRIVAYGLPHAHGRPVKIHLWSLGLGETGLLWSPDGKMLAVHRFYYNLSDPGDNDSLPTSTTQDISLFDCDTWREAEDALSWNDEVASPYRYHLVGWCGGHRWLVLLSDGVYKEPGITSERLIAYDTHTERFRSILQIDSWVRSIDWHSDGESD